MQQDSINQLQLPATYAILEYMSYQSVGGFMQKQSSSFTFLDVSK